MRLKILFQWLLFVITILPVHVSAQTRLPRVQLSVIKAEKRMVMDGNMNDWTKGFQAYNNRTDIYYSFANDDINIYLIIKAGSNESLKKVLLGGVNVTLEEDSSGRKDGETKIRYPAYNKSHPSWSVNWEPSTPMTNENFNRRKADSVMRFRNEMLAKKVKLIAVKESGLNTDTLYSIYNARGIKIRSKFDIESSYLIEWSIPLNLLPSKTRRHSIRYKIELPGGSAGGVDVMVDTERRVIFFTGATGGNYVLPFNAGNLDLASPTYFRGRYVLAK